MSFDAFEVGPVGAGHDSRSGVALARDWHALAPH